MAEWLNKIVNCADCRFHTKHQIWTPDSFEHEYGIFCSKTKADSTTLTLDGTIDEKLVVTDDWDPKKYAKVPEWCPMLSK